MLSNSLRYSRLALMLVALAAIAFAPPVRAQDAATIHIDVPVMLKHAKVVFNMDHAAFAGDTPVGLTHMRLMVQRFKKIGTDWKIVAVFHGEAGYMLLNDAKYDAVRKTKTGNPYKALIKNLADQGVAIEECAVTMKGHGWTNADLLPMVKVNAGADGRIIELVQQGYVMLQP